MSKKVKSLIEKELGERFSGVETVAVINPRGIDATKNNQIRRRLHEKGLKMTVVKNTLVKRAVASTKLKSIDQLLDGPSAVIYGDASAAVIARLLLEEKKNDDKLEMRGVLFDGDVYLGEKGVTDVSKLPTREEAISNILGAILGPGRKLAAALKGPGGKLGGVIKTIEDKAREKEGAAPASA
jgi:large subunit ribosomal protein L10